MSLKLIKTVGNTEGLPPTCKSCKSTHFTKSGISWHCTDCGYYIPADFGIGRSLEDIDKVCNKLNNLIKELKNDL